ncbi:hypothetical protein PDJAM_G00174310 [Pangasius djambal]|uniref:Uncharacterized protein n=1 Tax=Pangasius djambal TaxID=1691987 RepID=A0ACC5ZN70_9TELE|nr:hypothetical protein [Pangasius djambal]
MSFSGSVSVQIKNSSSLTKVVCCLSVCCVGPWLYYIKFIPVCKCSVDFSNLNFFDCKVIHVLWIIQKVQLPV